MDLINDIISCTKFIINLFLAIFLLNASVLGDIVKPSYTVISSKETITIDGLLDEPVWSQGEAISGFVQKDPRPNDPATHRTEVRVALDDEFIYNELNKELSSRKIIMTQINQNEAIKAFLDWEKKLDKVKY